MSPSLAMTVIVTLAALLALVSAVAGALWLRGRAWPLVEAVQLASELAERQRALEAMLAKLEKKAAAPGVKPGSSLLANPAVHSRRGRRFDRAEPTAITGPTLIAVPDLAAPHSPAAAAELGRRFGAVWELADAGLAPEEIARRTGQPIGQVELVLGLRRQLAAAGGRAS
jgi:hypothetical protein